MPQTILILLYHTKYVIEHIYDMLRENFVLPFMTNSFQLLSNLEVKNFLNGEGVGEWWIDQLDFEPKKITDF